MDAPDKISLSLKDNADVASAFAGASAGDKVTMTVELIIDEISQDLVVASVNETSDIKVSEGGDDEDSETENTDSEDASSDVGAQNVLAVMAPKSKK